MIQTSSQLTLQNIEADTYAQLFSKGPHIYNSVAFNELNRHKVEQLHYLVMADTKVRFGIIAGQRGNILLSPFPPHSAVSIQIAFNALKQWKRRLHY